MSKIFYKRPLQGPVADTANTSHSLKRHLGWVQLVVIGIGAIIGAGIFVITGKAAAECAGPAVTFSFIIAALICAVAGLCYAELASMIPSAGGSYAYTFVALGELPAWLVGWAVSAQYIFSASAVASGWAGYVKSFLQDFGIVIADRYSLPPLAYNMETGWELTGNFLNVPALLLVLGVGVLITVGIQAAARFTNAMVVIKLCTLALFIALGVFYIKPENWTPFVPLNTGVFGEFGFSGILRGAGLVFFAYVGFDTVATLAQDAISPQRDLPRGILGSLAISTVAYIAVALVLTGVAYYTTLSVPDPMAVALNALGPKFFWASSVVKAAIIAGLASVILVLLLGQSRVLLAIGEDGLLPKTIAKVHPRFRTPYIAAIGISLITALFTALFPVEILGQFVSIVTLFIFAVVCAAVWILRRKHPEHERPFRVPFAPWIPATGLVCCVAQMFFMPFTVWLQMGAWFALGLLIYFSYGFRRAR